ncbi:hypothetical protein EXN66_Car001985 [Channa argus]|uniref:Uncharacterized protein n=1 Tax=Channa argus TaxID=215402 RepID=A0A6G1P7Z5_CHAAH|nr:hypothetical protein EXN66_Car001985 [Channa argus]
MFGRFLPAEVIKLGTRVCNPAVPEGFDLNPCGVQQWPQWASHLLILWGPQNHVKKLYIPSDQPL